MVFRNECHLSVQFVPEKNFNLIHPLCTDEKLRIEIPELEYSYEFESRINFSEVFF